MDEKQALQGPKRLEYERMKLKIQRPNPLSSPAQTVLSRIGYQQYQSIQQEVTPRVTPITPSNPQYPSHQPQNFARGQEHGFSRKSNVIPVFAMMLSVFSIVAITYYYAYCANEDMCGPSASTSKANKNGHRTDVYHVFVVRHAERKRTELRECKHMTAPVLPPNVGDCFGGSNWCGGLYLVEEGHRRSKCIGKMDWGDLRHIYAQNPGTCNTTNVKREYQTVVPLAKNYGLSIDTTFYRDHEAGLAADLMSADRRKELCDNGTTVISWSHTTMPTLLQGLGCEEEECKHKVALFDFDTYFHVMLSCKDSSFVDLEVKTQPCHQPEDETYEPWDDDTPYDPTEVSTRS